MATQQPSKTTLPLHKRVRLGRSFAVFAVSIACLFTVAGSVAFGFSPLRTAAEKLGFVQPSDRDTSALANTFEAESEDQVLGLATGDPALRFHLPTFFSEVLTAAGLTITGDSVFEGSITVNDDVQINGNLFANNLLNSVTAGDGLAVTGSGDIIIENTDPGSAQSIFKTIKIDDTSVSADSNDASISFLAGENIDFSTSGSEVTINSAFTDTNTTYTAGNGLQLSTTSFSLKSVLTTVTSITVPDGGLIDLSNITHSSSTPQGLKLPQNTAANLTALSSGEGFLAWATDENRVKQFDGTSWADLATAGGGGTTEWTDSGAFIYPDEADYLGNNTSGGGNKLAGAYFADSSPLVFGTDNDITTSFASAVLGYSIGNNDINFDSDTLFIDGSADRVGIGTSLPSANLHVQGSVRITGALYDSSNSAGTSGYLLTSTGTGTQWSSSIGGGLITADSLDFTELKDALTLDADTSINVFDGTLDRDFRIYNSDSSDELLFVDASTGYLGFGTASPSTSFDFEIAVNAQNPRFYVRNTTAGAAGFFLQNTQGGWSSGVDGSGNYVFSDTNNLNTKRLLIQKSTGNVGIGTTSPAYKLDVNGTFGTNSTVNLSGLSAGDAVNTSVLALDGSNNVELLDISGYDTDSSDDLSYSLTSGYVPYANTTTSLADSVLYYNGTNVGIGTTNPWQKLEVNGHIALSGSQYLYFGRTQSSSYIGGGSNPIFSGFQEVNLAINGATKATLKSAGFGIGTTNPITKLDIQGATTGKALAILNETGDQALFTASASGATKFVIDNSGNVGIGTTSPAYKLDVNGTFGTNSTINLSGLSADDATSTKVLALDASNNVELLDLSTATLPSGTNGQTLYNNAGTWTATSNLFNDGTNVGIGTTNPLAALNVAGDLLVNSANGRIWGITGLAPGHTINFQYGGDSYNEIETTYGSNVTFRAYNGLQFTGGGSHTVIAKIGGNNGSTTSYFTGSLGIGTTSPQAALDVAGDIYTSSGISTFGTAVSDGTIEATQFCTGDDETNCITDFSSINLTAGSGIQINSSAISLGALTGDWSQTGAFDVILGSADSQLQILESVGDTYYGTIDVGNLSADATYSFSGASGTVWTSGNDGASSGLDADTLDTFSSGSFIRSDTNDAYTSGTLSFNGGTNLDINGNLYVSDTSINWDGASTNFNASGNFSINTSHLFVDKASGNVGIGTTSPGYKLDVAGVAQATSGFRTNSETVTDFTGTGLAISSGALGVADDGIDYAQLADSMTLDANYSVSQSSYTWTQSFTGTSSDAFSFLADSLTSGNAYDISVDALTSGNGIYIESTSTALTTGSLFNGYWNPSSATTASGDLFKLDIGANATLTGNLFALYNNGSKLFSVSTSKITSALPHEFTSAGDVSFAYDIVMTNQTASFISSYGPMTIVSGESYENLDLTLKAYGTGAVVIDQAALKLTSGENLIFDSNDSADTYLTHNNAGNYLSVFSDGTESVRFMADGSVDGNTTFDANQFDLAEYYPTLDSEIAAGDVVAVKTVESDDASVAPYLVEKAQASEDQQPVLGVVSTRPGFSLGGGSFRSEMCSQIASGADGEQAARQQLFVKEVTDSILSEEFAVEGLADADSEAENYEQLVQAEVMQLYAAYQDQVENLVVPQTRIDTVEDQINTCKALKQVPIALSGRVPVKIDTVNGEIKPGDLLTLSPGETGTAAKAVGPGWVIGRALESSKDNDTLMVFVFTAWYGGGNTIVSQLGEGSVVTAGTPLGAGSVTGNTSGDAQLSGQLMQLLQVSQPTTDTQLLSIGKTTQKMTVDFFNGKLRIGPDGTLVSLGAVQAKQVKAEEFTVLGVSDDAENQSSTLSSGSLAATETEVAIENSFVKERSKIFLTPTSYTQGQVLVVSSKSDGTFTVSIKEAIEEDIQFDYWIVQSE